MKKGISCVVSSETNHTWKFSDVKRINREKNEEEKNQHEKESSSLGEKWNRFRQPQMLCNTTVDHYTLQWRTH